MKFTEPIKNLKLKGVSDISQMFGENALPIYKQLGMKGHNGIDLIRKKGEPIYSATDGVIMKVNWEGNAGIYVRVMSGPVLLDGKKAMIETCYFHLLDAVVAPNQMVCAGQLIGRMDNTGYSTGTHLHFGIRPYWYKNGLWRSDKDNGYLGYVDPYPHLLKAQKIIMYRIIKASADAKKRWLIAGKFRFWILDPPTKVQGSGKLWEEQVEIDNPEKYEYAGAIFISKTDDPLDVKA